MSRAQRNLRRHSTSHNWGETTVDYSNTLATLPLRSKRHPRSPIIPSAALFIPVAHFRREAAPGDTFNGMQSV
jgi:hypothetical protein